MSYNFLAGSVNIFTRAFYGALLHKGVSFEYATVLAREALNMVRERTSRFGQPVEVDDSTVPIVYFHGGAPWSLNLKLSSPLEVRKEEVSQMRKPFGREDTILKLEAALIMGEKPVLLTGQAGVGKSELIDHLGSWWLATKFITDGYIFRLTIDYPWDLDNICRLMSEKFLPEQAYTGRKEVLEYVKQHRVMLVIDGIDTMTIPAGKMTRAQRKDLVYLLQQLTGQECFLLLTSRGKETWLGELANPVRLHGLKNLAGIQWFETAIEEESKYFGFATTGYTGSIEEKQFVEQIVKLVDGNPLAIKVLATSFVFPSKTVKDFFMELLSGAPLRVNRKAMERIEGWRSLVEIDALIDASNPKTLTDGFRATALTPFWKKISQYDLSNFVFHLTQASWKSFGESRQERISGYKKFFDHITDLVPEATPTTDNPMMKLLQQAFSMSDERKKEWEGIPDIETLFLLYPKLDLETIGDFPGKSVFHSFCNRLIKPFKEHGFLEELDPLGLPLSLHSRRYLSIHPLLPIMLRSEPDWAENLLGWRGFIKKGYIMHYASRSKCWPMVYQYFNPIWEGPRHELNVDFINYASSTMMFLQEETSSTLHDSIVMRTMSVMHRGVLGDVSRQNVLVYIWEAAIKILLKKEESLQGQKPDIMTMATGWINDLVLSKDSKPKLSTYSTESNVEIPQNLLLYSVRVLATNISCQLTSHYHRVTCTKQHEYLAIVERLHKDILNAGFPEEVDAEFMKKTLDDNLWNARAMVGKVDLDLDELWPRRQDFMEFVTGHYGVETVPESHTDLHHLPIDVNAQSAPIVRLFPAVTRIRKAIEEDRLDDARKLIDEAMLVEINEAGNDESNKATLLRYRSEVEEKQENWEDALLYYDEARMREDQAVRAQGGQPVQPGIYQQTPRMMKRNKLVQKVKEAQDNASFQT